MRQLKASFLLIALLINFLPLVACKQSIQQMHDSGVSMWVAFRLPFVPLKFIWDSKKGTSVKAEASIPLPGGGSISFGPGYDLTPEPEGTTASLPAPIGDLDVIIRDSSTNQGEVYSISTNDQEFVAIFNGETKLTISNRQIIIDISNGVATTSLAAGQFTSLGILPAPVAESFVLEDEPVIQHPGSFPQKLSNCDNDSDTTASFPKSSEEPFIVATKGDVEWEIEGSAVKGTGTYFNGGKLPVELDLAQVLRDYQPQSNAPARSIRWDVPVGANSEADYVLKWWEVWRQGHIDVSLMDRKIARIVVRYFVDINYGYELRAMRMCARPPLAAATPFEPSRDVPPSSATPQPQQSSGNAVLINGLIRAAQSGEAGAIKLWLDRGADINGRATTGRTALMAAVGNGHSDAARFLLERGADINSQDGNGRTALMVAAAGGHDDTVRLLLQWRADVNVMDSNGMTAQREAARRGNSSIVSLLQRAGAWR